MSSLYDTARIRRSGGVAQWARQSSEFLPEIEGTDAVLKSGGAAVVQAQPEDPDLCIGRSIAFHLAITSPPSDRLHPGQPDSARLGSGGPIAFQLPSVHGHTEVRERLPDIDPNFTANSGSDNNNWDRMVFVLRLGGAKKRRQHSIIFSSYARSSLETNCEPGLLQTYDRRTARMDKVNLSFKFPAARRQNSVEWSDWRRNRQERMRARMPRLGRASSEEGRQYMIRKVGKNTDRSLRLSQVAYGHDL